MRTRRNRQRKFSGRSTKNNKSIIFSLVSTFTAFLIKDISSKDSKVLSLIKKVFPRKISQKTQNKIITPKYEVLPNTKENK